jgi:hypothetical protein
VDQVAAGRRESTCECCLSNRLFCPQHLTKFGKVLDRFFTILTITPSFLIRFWPVKCRIEALIMFFRMVKERSVRFSFWSGQRSGQTLVKLGQNSPNSGKRILDRVSRVFGHSGPRSGQKRSGQTWSTLVKHGRTSGDVSRTFFLGLFDVAHPRWIRPARFRLSRFACRHPRKSRG